MIFFAWVIAGLGIGAVLFGWFWDRPGFRGRAARRCKKCWYDLSDSGPLPITCPECGHESKSERSMRRVRRQKKVVAVGLVLVLIAPAVLLIHGYRQGRLFVHVPSWVLIESLPYLPSRPRFAGAQNASYASTELAYRLGGYDGREASHEQIVDILNRAAAGNLFVTPGSKRWGRTTGQWFNGQIFRFREKGSGWPYVDDTGWQYPDGTPADEALIGALDRIMRVIPAWDAHTRSVWPEGEVMTVWSGAEYSRWPVKGELIESASLVISGHQDEPEQVEIRYFGNHFQLKARGQAGDTIRCEMELRYHRVFGDWYSEPLPEPERTQHVVLEWTIAEKMSDVIELVDNEQIREAMIVEVVPWLSNSIDEFDFGNTTWLEPAFAGIGFGVRVQVYDGDELLAQAEHRWINVGKDSIHLGTSMMGTTMEQYNAYPLRAQEAIEKGTLRVKIIGDPALALEVYDAKQAWNGEIDILYSDAVEFAESPEGTAIPGEKPGKEKAP